MNVLLTIVLILVGLIAALWLIWRFASKRHTLPCPAWLSVMVEMDNPFTKVNRAQTIIEHLNLQPGMRVLDIGCGPGRLAIPLAKALAPNGQVVALDIQQEMLDKVRKKAEEAGLTNIDYVNIGVGQGNLALNGFDRILLATVIGEIPQTEAAFKEIHAALAKDGILSVTELIFDPHFQRQKTVLGLAEKTGFRCQAVFGNSIAYTMHLVKA